MSNIFNNIEKKAAQSSTILLMLSKYSTAMEPSDVAVLIDLASELSAEISSWFVDKELESTPTNKVPFES
ncbi:exported hypothetical protein [Xenorhabdus nematophila F1]|uniref:hypothetical protein n=1 Tax=Xenorhabdus nematophila TaxID=628 RepID=UPI0003275C72|nr:hypothetical protein [Xenorhabdus nematophila]CCW31042.1 exported hypothetical protein [Xenorhabdus nematophila F1]